MLAQSNYGRRLRSSIYLPQFLYMSMLPDVWIYGVLYSIDGMIICIYIIYISYSQAVNYNKDYMGHTYLYALLTHAIYCKINAK